MSRLVSLMCSRYLFPNFAMSISSSFGYPEEVEQSPGSKSPLGLLNRINNFRKVFLGPVTDSIAGIVGRYFFRAASHHSDMDNDLPLNGRG